jgi:hypothetical protein
MIWACLLGYTAIAVSFYLYITRTAQVETEAEEDSTSGTPNLTIVAGGTDQNITRKAA